MGTGPRSARGGSRAAGCGGPGLRGPRAGQGTGAAGPLSGDKGRAREWPSLAQSLLRAREHCVRGVAFSSVRCTSACHLFNPRGHRPEHCEVEVRRRLGGVRLVGTGGVGDWAGRAALAQGRRAGPAHPGVREDGRGKGRARSTGLVSRVRFRGVLRVPSPGAGWGALHGTPGYREPRFHPVAVPHAFRPSSLSLDRSGLCPPARHAPFLQKPRLPGLCRRRSRGSAFRAGRLLCFWQPVLLSRRVPCREPLHAGVRGAGTGHAPPPPSRDAAGVSHPPLLPPRLAHSGTLVDFVSL